jgi:glycosyltransferase involved in cell wall biosynthesis
MHVLIEALSARMGGGITRLLGIVEALPRVAPQHRYSIVLSSSYQQGIIDALPPEVRVIDVRSGTGLLRRAWFQSVTLPRIGRSIGADAVFAASEGAYLRAPLPVVMMCGNLLLFRHDSLSARLRRPVLRRAMQVAKKIAFVSETIREAARTPPGKSFVVHHGVDRRFQPRTGESAEPYYLAVSSIAAHKGYETLLDAYALLPRDVPPLRIAGGVQDPEAHRRLVAKRDALGLGGRVEFLGSVAPESLPALYAGARALLFPSEVESFGLPLVEAMATGVPVIASGIPVCREICGEAALYVPPRDATNLAALIAGLDSDPGQRRDLGNAGVARARRFTWEDAARLLVAELENSVNMK